MIAVGESATAQKFAHLVAHRLGVEDHALRILHPSVSDEDPYCRDSSPDDGEPAGG